MDKQALLRSLVKEVMDSWDPESLLEIGAPKDEYDSETGLIVDRIEEIVCYRSCTEVIREVFEHFFAESSEGAYTFERCKGVGERLFNILKANKFVDLSHDVVNILIVSNVEKSKDPPSQVSITFDRVVIPVPVPFQTVEAAQLWAKNFVEKIEHGRCTVTMDSSVL